ncbi:MAG: Ig-like domain-containing protein, partial [Planctomycetota bacterium]
MTANDSHLFFAPEANSTITTNYQKALIMKAFVLQSIFFLLGAGALVAQTINATQSDDFSLDNKVTNRADPGDKIRYTIIVSGSGADATGVQVTVNPDALTTLVSGSFKTSPVAVNDGTYDCIGNVGITVPAASGVKINDFDDNLAGATLSCGTCLSANGGTVTIANDGSFTYLPAAGFTGLDNFTYTLTDVTMAGPGAPTTDMATVSINVAGMIWFVDENQGSNGTGRLGSPFNTMNNYINGATDDPSDNIFLYSSGDNYVGNLALLNNQKLIGEGATVTLASATGLTVPTHSNALPVTGGIRPFLTTGSGATILLASGNTIRGVNMGDTDATEYAIRDDGASVGSLTISEATIATAKNGFRAANGGALNVTFTSITVADGTGNGIVITGGATGTFNGGIGSISNTAGAAVLISDGTVAVDYDGTLVKNSVGGRLVDIQNHATGAITFDGNLTSNAAGATGIFISNNTSGTISFNGSSKLLTTNAITALDFTNNTGTTINFANGGLDVNVTIATAFTITGGGTVNVSGSGNTINSTSGTAFNNDGTGGSATIDINAAITSTTGRLIDIQNRAQNNNVTLSGNLSNSGTGIQVANNSSGTMTFSGSSKSLTTGTNNAMSITTNSGASISFTNGGLVIST